jgi:hypothetical protein
LSDPGPGAARLGRTPGMKPVHAVVAGLFALLWIVVLALVLLDGKDEGSSVDVYSELPPGFTAALQAKGVRYTGLSPVASGTVDEVLAHAPAEAGAPSGVDPIVLRTSFSSTARDASFQDRAALMVVVPQSESQSGSQSQSGSPSASGAGGSVYVAFLDPTSYQVLTSLTYSGANASG